MEIRLGLSNPPSPSVTKLLKLRVGSKWRLGLSNPPLSSLTKLLKLSEVARVRVKVEVRFNTEI